MKSRQPAIVSTAAVIAIVLGLALMAISLYVSNPGWAAPDAPARQLGGPGGPGVPMARLCSARRDERLNDMIVFVESFVDFSSEQTAAWNGLTMALRDGSDTIGMACDELRADGRPETAPDKLARLEAMMTAGLLAVRQVRPAFDDFYAALDDEQKRAIDALASRKRRPGR